MSRDFKLNLRSLSGKEETPGPPTPVEAELPAVDEGENLLYPTPGTGRTLGIVWPEGKKRFFNYAYLISGEWSIEVEYNQIILNFSSHKVTIKGYQLEGLYEILLLHQVRLLEVKDKRYAKESSRAVVSAEVITTI